MLKVLGNPSGQESTTDDNDVVHTTIMCFMFRLIYKASYATVIRTWIRVAMYADDHVFSCDRRLKISSYEIRSRCYALLGVKLSKEKDLITSTLEGQVFLGLTFHFDVKYQTWVPIFNAVRGLNALHKSETNQDLVQYFSKCCAVMLLLAFVPQFWVARDWTASFYRKNSLSLSKYSMFTHTMCVDYWFGRETCRDIPVEFAGLISDSLFELLM